MTLYFPPSLPSGSHLFRRPRRNRASTQISCWFSTLALLSCCSHYSSHPCLHFSSHASSTPATVHFARTSSQPEIFTHPHLFGLLSRLLYSLFLTQCQSALHTRARNTMMGWDDGAGRSSTMVVHWSLIFSWLFFLFLSTRHCFCSFRGQIFPRCYFDNFCILADFRVTVIIQTFYYIQKFTFSLSATAAPDVSCQHWSNSSEFQFKLDALHWNWKDTKFPISICQIQFPQDF